MLNKLRNIGLSDKEARVYVAMLELGPASVQNIATKAGINRPTTYVQIESLKKMGLVSSQQKNKKQLYIPESPEQLEVIIARQLAETEEKKKMLESVLPEMVNLYAMGEHKPQVRFLEGKEALKVLLRDFLTVKNKQLLGISNIDLVVSMLDQSDIHKYSRERVNKGINAKFIFATANDNRVLKTDPENLRETLYLPYSDLPFIADMTIYGDKVAIATLEKGIVCVVIQHPQIANSFRALFNMLWALGVEKK